MGIVPNDSLHSHLCFHFVSHTEIILKKDNGRFQVKKPTTMATSKPKHAEMDSFNGKLTTVFATAQKFD
jgi:hypothetical protein